MAAKRIGGDALLFAFLKRNGISYAKAAIALGVSAPAVFDWANGKKCPVEGNRKAIDVWTSGEVPGDSWGADRVRPVVPYKPTGTEG